MQSPSMTSESAPCDPAALLRPRRRITGMSAVLLPFNADQTVDWQGLEQLLDRTFQADLIPAVNMDTGYSNLIDEETRRRVLELTHQLANHKPFVAGAFVNDRAGDTFRLDRYQEQIKLIQEFGGDPVIFQSFGLTSLPEPEIIDAYTQIASSCEKFYAFELGQMFLKCGRIYTLDTYRRLLEIPQCVGAKHSSLNRQLEWQRLTIRDQTNPEFLVLTGNDLAIDMVIYGSDYLLGLSTFAPDLFARRDRYWEAGDPLFYELNDTLQYLGCLTFRAPTPAYKHSAAMFLKLRGWLKCDATHPESPKRPASDHEILADILDRLQKFI